MRSKEELLKLSFELYHRPPDPDRLTPEEGLKKIEQALHNPSLRNGLSEEQVRQAYEFAKQVVEKHKAKTPV